MKNRVSDNSSIQKEDTMTDKQALRKVKMMFGKNGACEKSRVASEERLRELNPQSKSWLNKYIPMAGKMRYVVGEVIYGFAFEIKGEGLSWEEAFEDAVKKPAVSSK